MQIILFNRQKIVGKVVEIFGKPLEILLLDQTFIE